MLSKIIPVPEKVKPEGLSNRSVVTRAEGCEESSLEQGGEGSDESVLYIMVVVTHLYALVKTHKTIRLVQK